LAAILTILNKDFLFGFLQCRLSNAGTVLQNTLGLLYFTFWSVHYSVTILPFDSIQSELLKASLNKQTDIDWIHLGHDKITAMKLGIPETRRIFH
jgi:hypothetical protein